MLRIVFMGTSSFAVPPLEKIQTSHHELIAVVTQPDRPRGRGKKYLPSPVKEKALAYGAEVFQPEKMNTPEAIDQIFSYEPDLIVVASYGQIIPTEILDLPRYGCINVHASMLPRYRGAAPIQRAIMSGDAYTGVSIMFMDEGLDTGDIIMQVPVPIEDDMDHGKLEEILSQKGSELLMDVVAIIESGSMPRKPQDIHKSSYAKMIKREEEKINWHLKATEIRNHIRALSPKPAAYTSFQGIRFKIFSSCVMDMKSDARPGEIVDISSDGFIVQTGQGALEILEVQKEGKKKLLAPDFLKGFKLMPGDVLD